MRRLLRIAPVLLATTLAACATTGRAVPRPFPGAALPPTAPEPVAAQPENPPPAAVVTPETPVEDLPAVVLTALMLRGSPYRNGGTDPSGFDCSGFVQYVFSRHGQRLPRETREQFVSGTEVDRDQVRAGDLVFFETVAKGASHVGIALDGDRFVHAPSSRGVVRVERLTTDYWARKYVGARRVLPEALE